MAAPAPRSGAPWREPERRGRRARRSRRRQRLGQEHPAGPLPAELGFEHYRGYRVEELSGGTRQKLNLALSLMHDPALLLLDEPYRGSDWETYLRFWEMTERRRANGIGILVVSHLLSERDRLDRIYELRQGRTIPT